MVQSRKPIEEAYPSLSAEDQERLKRYGITPESSEKDMIDVILHQISELRQVRQNQV